MIFTVVYTPTTGGRPRSIDAVSTNFDEVEKIFSQLYGTGLQKIIWEAKKNVSQNPPLPCNNN